jgi:hypothetical protein
MSDISNKTLVALLVIAIVVSLAGTWISIGKLKAVTGFGTQTGTTPLGNVTITQQTALEITLYYDTLSFGTGRVNTTNGNTYCNISTNLTAASTVGTGNTFTNNFAGAKGGTDKCNGFLIPAQGFEIENTGTVSANVSYNSSNIGWINGTSLVGGYFFQTGEEGDACAEANTAAWTSLTETKTQICGNLATTSTANAFQMAIKVSVPADLANGTHSDKVTFYAVNS